MQFLYVFLTVIGLSLNPVFSVASAHEAHTESSHQTAKTSLAISVAFDDKGQLWRVRQSGAYIVVDKSTDLGKHFSDAVKVNTQPLKIAANGEARPKIKLSAQGHIYLTWTQLLKKPFAGHIWFARSIDGGKSFEKPYIVHQDRAEITHRFDALQIASNGNITVAWVDKRDLITAKSAGKPYQGAAIYYAVSTDQGQTFKTEQKLADSSCECCRIAMASNPKGDVVAFWRHIFNGGERDHMIGEIPQTPEQKPVLKRATYGHWKIDGCPHHGAALASGGAGEKWWGYHMAYFDGKAKKPGLYYSRVDGEAWAFFPPKKFGDHKKLAGHPALLSISTDDAEHVWLVWRETKAKNNTIMGMFSDDGGRSWQDAKPLAHSVGKTDYPQLLKSDQQAYLVWNTSHDGLQVLALE